MPSLLLLLLLLLAATTSAAAPAAYSTEDSTKQNSVGSCKWSFRVGKAQSLGVNDLVVWKFPASAAEVAAYESLRETKTLANELLGTSKRTLRWGKVKQLSWQLPAEHPRQNRSLCVELAAEAGRDGTYHVFYASRRRLLNEFHIYEANNALIDDKGVLALPCGYVQAHESCETHYRFIGRQWLNKCFQDLNAHKSRAASLSWEEMFKDPQRHGGVCLKAPVPTHFLVAASKNDTTPPPTPPPPSPHNWEVHDKVFLITSGWDNNYHHFIVDSLSRLIRHYDWLQANPDVHIHIRGFEAMAKKERFVQGGRDMRKRILELLRLAPGRFITGPALARKVWLPRATGCNAPMGHALELRLLARRMIMLAHDAEWTQQDLFAPGGPLYAPLRRRPRVILQHRHCQTEAACKREKWREMNNDTFALFVSAIRDVLQPSAITIFSSSNATQKLPSSLPSEVAEYNQADILIGAHGAGLTNVMFMRPGSLVVELVGDFDGRMGPVCGYHGPLSAIFGVHHYIHYFEYRDISNNYRDIYPFRKEHFEDMALGSKTAWERLIKESGGKGFDR